MKRHAVNLLAFIGTVAAVAAILWLLTGCASEGQTMKHTAMVAGGAAAGSFFGPLCAAIGAGVAYLFGEASDTGGPVIMLGPFGSIGHWLDGVIWWAVAGFVLLMLLVPAMRDNFFAALSSRMPLLDRLKALLAATTPFVHSPPAAQVRKLKREANKEKP